MSEPSISTPPADRYGTKRSRPVSGRRAKILTAAAIVVAVALVAWFTVAQTRTDPMTYDVVGFEVPSPEQIDVTFQVHMPPGTTGHCTVDALASTYAQVGELDVPVGPSKETTSSYTVTVRTSEEATTGVVSECLPAD